MRILASIHLFYPRHCCGSESMLLSMFKYLIGKGHHCRVILHQYSGQIYTYEGVEVFPANGRIDAYQWADVIVTHLDYTQFTIAMGMTAKRPVVSIVHNDIHYSCIESGVRSQYVIYNSNWIKDNLKYKWPSIVMHPPCDIKYYNVNDNPEENEYITLISLNERKGGYILHKIAAAMPDKKFMGVVGSYDNPGPMKLIQPQIIAMLQDLPNVTVIDNSPDILSVYRKTRLLIMPSDYETWGRTATEAMANGIPVICTPTTGLKENCSYAGTYVGELIEDPQPGWAQVKTGTLDQWISAIRSLDDKQVYHKKSLACRQRAAELDPEKELEQLEQFLLNARF